MSEFLTEISIGPRRSAWLIIGLLIALLKTLAPLSSEVFGSGT
jgi:hypothetical protein